VRIHGVEGYKVYPRTVVDRGIVSLYHRARVPQPDPVAPFDAETVQRVDELSSQVRELVEK